MEASERFSNRVDDYVRYRPQYPPALVALLAAECGLVPAHVVADVGSGTGILSGLFLDHGNTVYAVEPNAPMRAAAEKIFQDHPCFRSVPGSAEHTGLGDASVDMVVAGQAFHWFDAPAARAEFRRIVRPGGWVALIWNERQAAEPGFPLEYEALLHAYSIDYAAVDHRQVDAARIAAFFNPAPVSHHVLANAQVLDRDGLAGRVRSCSYMPGPGHPRFEPLMAALDALFARHAASGTITMAYDTTVYLGQLGV